MGLREARKGEEERKDILDRFPTPHPAALSLIGCLSTVGDEWQIGRDDLKSESTPRWQTRNSSLSSQELDRLMRVKITSLDFRYKNDFPYL